jgi:hypothetical protein
VIVVVIIATKMSDKPHSRVAKMSLGLEQQYISRKLRLDE